jgi:translation initiation factor 3 subunit H
MAEQESKVLREVHLDSLVLLKIIQHCEESDGPAVGHLIGHDLGDKIDITYSFALPSRPTDSNITLEKYPKKILKRLEKCQLENSQVGWYQRAEQGLSLDINSAEYQYNFQKEFFNAVMIVYDPLLEASSSHPLKAYRLSQEFIEFYESEDYTQAGAVDAGLDSTKIFNEIPVEVQNSVLTRAFLAEFGPDQFTAPKLSVYEDALQKNLSTLNECVEELNDKNNKMISYVKSLQKQKVLKRQFEEKKVVDK